MYCAQVDATDASAAVWFNLSDPGTEDTVYVSYTIRKFTGINFLTGSVPDETTLCNFRHILGGTQAEQAAFQRNQPSDGGDRAYDEGRYHRGRHYY